MLELDGTKDQKEDDIGRLFMLTFNGDPDIANDLACLNLDINGRGVACIIESSADYLSCSTPKGAYSFGPASESFATCIQYSQSHAVVKRPPSRGGNGLQHSSRVRQDETRTIVQGTHHVLSRWPCIQAGCVESFPTRG